MVGALRNVARVTLLAALAVHLPTRAEDPVPCKNHYILRCAPVEPLAQWEVLPDSLMAHGTGHTASLLLDGGVLVVGGSPMVKNPGPGRPTTTEWSAEVFDPKERRWQATGPMSYPRWNHSATRLADGRVLVVGGDDVGGPLTHRGTAEVFDPATGTWSLTGTLNIPRAAFTATLLPNGTVLVAGGVDNSDNTVASAEIYDPAAGTWRFTGKLVEPRLVHTATALADGRVLLVGGMTDDFFMWTTGGAEIFDPATETWLPAGGVDPRWMHTATLLEDGRVVVAGGYISQPPPGGGWYQASSVEGSAIFDPAKGSWTDAGGLMAPRHRHLAAHLRGYGVLLYGGSTPMAPIPRYAQAVVEEAEFLPLGGSGWRAIAALNSLAESAGDYYSITEIGEGMLLFIGNVDGARARLLRY